MPDRTLKLLISTPARDIQCQQSQNTSSLRFVPTYTVSAALRDLAAILNAKSASAILPTVPQNRPSRHTFPSADMKFPPSASITFKKNTSSYCEEGKRIDTSLWNNLSPEERSGTFIDTHNNSAESNSFSKIVMDATESSSMNKSMDVLNKESEMFQNRRRRFSRKDSGFSSSGSDEDATGSKCECDAMRSRLRPRRPQRHFPHWLAMSRSQSWSSLDSAIADSADQSGTYSPSECSSPLSSVWSLTSSRNNLSLSPSLDSQLWGSGTVSCEDTVVPAAPSSKLSCIETEACETNTPRTNTSSEISTTNSERCSSFSEELDRDEESLDITTQVESTNSGDRNITIGRIPTETSTVISRPASEQSYRQIRARRRQQGRDHNNNTSTRHGMAVRDYLPASPGRLGDCFRKNGLLSLVALIIYTLALMVVFSLLGAVGKSLKAAVGKQDLKEMRRSLASTRRSRRAPATSG